MSDEQDVLWSEGSWQSGTAMDGGPIGVFWKATAITQGTLQLQALCKFLMAAAVSCVTLYCVSRADPGRREKRLELAV